MRHDAPPRSKRSGCSRAVAIALAATWLLGGAASAHAVVTYWGGDLTGNWFSDLAWSVADVVPKAADTASFRESSGGIPFVITDVALSGSTTISALFVSSPMSDEWTFTGSNGAILTATSGMVFYNEDFQSLNVHRIVSLGLNTPQVETHENAILSLSNSTVTTDMVSIHDTSRVDVGNGARVLTNRYRFFQPGGELRVYSGGELRVVTDNQVLRGTTTILAGGQLNALPGVDLEYNGTALLQFGGFHAVDHQVHLKATGGGDITAASYLDVGNGVTGSLTVTGAGSTLTAGNVSDWGFDSSGAATVTVADSGVATVATLRAGTSDASFVGNVTSSGKLQTTSTFSMGGGTTLRTVQLNVNGGTFETDGLATFNNRADLNLSSGTVNFDGDATVNAGGRINWIGGTLNLGAGTTLLVDGGAFNRSSTTGFILSNSTTTRIRNGGLMATASYFDLGNATLDMNGGTLTVGAVGGTISDWASTTTSIVTLTNNAVATYNSGLRMSQRGGVTNTTVSGGAKLTATGELTAGGATSSNVILNVTGGRVESNAQISLLRGTTATISAAGQMEAQNILLSAAGGNASVTVTGAGSLLRASGTLTAGLEGTTALTVSGGAKIESGGAAILGELAGAVANVNVTGSGTRLDVGSSLTVGGSGTAFLKVENSAFVPVTGGVTVNSSSKIMLQSNAALQVGETQSIVNSGEINLSGNSELRAAVDSSGRLEVFTASISRSVTLQSGSDTYVDNASFGSLTQQAGADLFMQLRGINDFDNLNVSGLASLHGNLVVSLGLGYVPAAGHTFDLLDWGSRSGAFAELTLPALTSGLMWNTSQLDAAGTLSVTLAGDFDFDGRVDGSDFLVWQRGESPNSFAPADLADWKAHFGEQAISSTAIATPEPAAWGLAITAAIALSTSFRFSRCGNRHLTYSRSGDWAEGGHDSKFRRA